MRTKNREKMEQIKRFVNDKYFLEGYVPNYDEIAEAVGFSKANVCLYLQDMIKLGMIDSIDGRRGVRTYEINKAMSCTRALPVVGEIACGTPLLAEENIESYLYVSADFIGKGEHFVLKAHGDSMINANIDDGDYVIVRRQNTANEGQIVVALIEDSATLKRYYRDDANKRIRLHPENDDMQDMFFDEIEIQGVVKKIIKDCE